ncbi:hypothetical protein MLD38_002255 [Melastoma candidum]|uniref:Uncharacterized protein n=1 Tax=Melastoma candidum TaxID=119954 RepID=A0ACB9SH46_9MYRT|nr:hypothetical protein MLD38_002255 [Melastoma candidum]
MVGKAAKVNGSNDKGSSNADGNGGVRARQAFAVVNSGGGAQDPGVDGAPASNAGSDCGGMEFSREDVEALLNDRPKAKSKFNYKERCENMSDYIKRLRLCIKWFQEVEVGYVQELGQLRVALESAEQRLDEIEFSSKRKEEELSCIVDELSNNLAFAQEKLAKEEADKVVAVDSLAKEKEGRLASEKALDSVSADLAKAQEDLSSSSQRLATINDMYKRLQEYNASLQEYNCKLQLDLSTASENLKRSENEKLAFVEDLSSAKGGYNSIQEQFASLKVSHDKASKQKEVLSCEVSRLRVDLNKVRDERDRHLTQTEVLTEEVTKYKEYTGRSAAELGTLMIKSNELEAKCLSQSEQIKVLREKLTITERRLKDCDLSAMELRTESEEQKEVISHLQSRLSEAEFKVVEGEKMRKKLHNTVLDLKGNVRVLCRVRPLLPEDNGSGGKILSYPTSMDTQGRGIELLLNGQKHSFLFDKVFTPEASQEDVFLEMSQLVQSAIDGYKVCVFAYGQTGSGKTYTMLGRPGHADEKGLIPRSLEQIFQTTQSLKSQGWNYEMQGSILEIYNETIRDLLPSSQLSIDSSQTENSTAKQHLIKHDANGNTSVSNLTVVDIHSTKEVSYLLNHAARSRSVGKTQMNEESSRSHFVFALRISGVNMNTEQRVQGVLNLIDLAGSERLSKSGSTGDRLKETQAINKSLSSLSDVFFSLAKKEDHVPFRNSNLTYLLQPCLGGNAKTLMFVNISPDSSSIGESLSSLRFAARVNACEIGVPRRQTNTRTPDSRLSFG